VCVCVCVTCVRLRVCVFALGINITRGVRYVLAVFLQLGHECQAGRGGAGGGEDEGRGGRVGTQLQGPPFDPDGDGAAGCHGQSFRNSQFV
jgi:hypothetical protein